MKSRQAKAAKEIKSILTDKFPDTKFSVTSDSFAGGDAVRVKWTDGATTDQVKQLVDHYQEGSFDGMRDIYEYSNSRDDIPQVKYVTYSRSWSDEAKAEIRAGICNAFGIDPDTLIHERPEQLGGMELRTKMHRQFADTDYTE